MPMDETLAAAAIDLSDRPHCVVHAKIKAQKVGDFTVELMEDFFQGFAQAAKANVHLRCLYGRSSHHQVETLLKTQEPEGLRNSTAQQQNNAFTAPTPNDLLQSMPDISPLSNGIDNPMESLPGTFGQLQQGETALPDADLGLNNEFSWEMISLGLEEPLPAQDVIDELCVFRAPCNHDCMLTGVR